MRKGQWKIKISACMLLLLVGFGCMQVKAQENKQGSITISLNDIGSEMQGVKFRCYQVAVPADSTTWTWKTRSCFAGVDVDLNSLDKSSDYQEAAQKLAEWKDKEKAKQVTGITDSQGKLVFKKLDPGIYLIEQKDSASYGNVAPFLAIVPGLEDGTYVYDVVTYTKGESFPTVTPTDDTGKKDPGTKGSGSVKTGDTADPLFFICLVCVDALIIGLLLIKKNKKDIAE